MEKLTERQRRFVLAYAKSGIAESAAVEAGYSKRTARGSAGRLLANAGVKLALKKLATESETEAVAGIMELRRFWTKVVRGEEVDFDRETGKAVPPSMSARNKAAELLGKSQGAFLDRIDHTSSDGSLTPKPAIDVTKLSDAALAELIALQDAADPR